MLIERVVDRVRRTRNKWQKRFHDRRMQRIIAQGELVQLHTQQLDVLAPELAAILYDHSTQEEEAFPRLQKHQRGSVQQRDRIAQVADLCARNWPGDFVEIGCLRGRTTVRLAEVARKYDRRVIALDPWEVGTQNIDGGEYEVFLETIAPYADIIDIIRKSSLDKAAIEQVAQRTLAFAYVDGLHTYDASLSDIQTVGHCEGIIGVDDVRWLDDLAISLRRGGYLLNRLAVHHPPCREAYLLPPRAPGA